MTTTAPTPPPIAVLGRARIADALRDVGFRPVTGDSFKDIAVEINKLLSESPQTPIVADLSMAGETGFEYFVGDLAERAQDGGSRLVLLATDPASPLAEGGRIPGALVVPLPATVADIVRAAGFQLPAIPAAEAVVEPDRPVAAPTPIPIPVPVPVPIPTSLEPESVPELRPDDAPVIDEDEEDAAPQDDEGPEEPEIVVDELARARAARDAELAAQMAELNARVDAGDASALADMAETETPEAPADAAVVDVADQARATVDGFDQMPQFMRQRILDDLAAEASNEPAPVAVPIRAVEPEAAPAPTRASLRMLEHEVFPDTSNPIPDAGTAPVAPPVAQVVPAAPVAAPDAPAPAAPAELPAPVAWDAPAAEPAPVEQDSWSTAPSFTVPPAYQPNPAPAEPIRTPVPNLYGQPSGAISAAPKRGILVVVVAGSGGVGKTSTAIDLAKVASETLNPVTGKKTRVVLVDANRGQPDVHKRMRLPEGVLPTVYDTAATGQPSASFVLPAAYNPYRAASIDQPLSFACVFGPLSMDADATPAYAYGQAIDYARANADIVIVDTQIIEATQSDLFREVLIPRLRDDGWLVAAYDHKGTSKDNIFERLSELVGRDGVPRSHVLIVARNVYAFPQEAVEQVEQMIGGNGTFAGAMLHDDTYERETDIGRFRTDLPSIAPVIGRLLQAITGNHAYAQNVAAAEQTEQKKTRGLLGWIRR